MDIFIQQHYVCLTLRSWRHHNVQCLSHLNLMLFSPPPPTALRGLNSRQINLRTCVPGPPFKKKTKNLSKLRIQRTFLPACNLLCESGLQYLGGSYLKFWKATDQSIFQRSRTKNALFLNGTESKAEERLTEGCPDFYMPQEHFLKSSNSATRTLTSGEPRLGCELLKDWHSHPGSSFCST